MPQTSIGGRWSKNNNVSDEVEFVTAIGMTVAVLTLTPADIRPVYSEEILHVRPLKSLSMKAFA